MLAAIALASLDAHIKPVLRRRQRARRIGCKGTGLGVGLVEVGDNAAIAQVLYNEEAATAVALLPIGRIGKDGKEQLVADLAKNGQALLLTGDGEDDITGPGRCGDGANNRGHFDRAGGREDFKQSFNAPERIDGEMFYARKVPSRLALDILEAHAKTPVALNRVKAQRTEAQSGGIVVFKVGKI